jgi:TetR/AcrR family transcriptional repressor of nem operon
MAKHSEAVKTWSSKSGLAELTKGEVTRRDIIRQAAPIFNRKGFEGAAISDLMLATGLEKGGIYRHFSSKQQLAAEAFDYAWKIAWNTRLANIDEIPNAVDRLRQMVRNFRDLREGLVPGGCPLMNTAIDTDSGNVLLRRKAKVALEGWLGRLQSIVKEGQRRHEVRADAVPQQVATTIVSTLEGSLMIARLQRSEEPLQQGCRHLERYLESEVRAPESQTPRPKS